MTTITVSKSTGGRGPSYRKIHEQQISYVDNSNVEVIVDALAPSVLIADRDDADNCVLLQGHEADDFINNSDALFHRCGYLTRADARKICAYPMVDMLD